MVKGTTVKNSNGGCSLHWTVNPVGQHRHLLQAAAFYLAVLAILWCIRACIYHRISETDQVVLTLVDTAAAGLQNLAEPKIDHEFTSLDRASIKNSTLSGNSQVRQSDHVKETAPTTQIPSPPIVDETTERSNNTNVLGDGEEALLPKKITAEEPPEVVVIVRAEQKINTDELELRVEEEDTSQTQVPEELSSKIDDTFATAPELNDTAARARLVGDSRDETAAAILNGLVTSGPTEPHEDIPSFSEWAQKRLEEAEKKKTHPNASVQTPGSPGRGVSGMKIRNKNYASPDCGAKIVAANPEASSAKNVLVSTRDEYMLNACTSRVWFVVELCEAIQAKKIELANFELFSSSPKDFSVYVSDRFPTKDWSPVGQFTAKDVKDVQSFALHPHFFGKFIKVELQSHYGSEHFCPVSLFRAYGTSEFEVLETETENETLEEKNPDEDDDEDSDEEELLDSEGGDSPSNLFGSARDAVLNVVKKAAEILVKSSGLTGNNITQIQQSIDHGHILDNSYTSCTTPRYTILCGNCTDQKFASVFQLVSCKNQQLDGLLRIDLVNRTLRRGKLCGLHGVEIQSFWRGREDDKTRHDDTTTHFNLAEDLQATFLTSFFKPEYIIALCNVLATKERKVVMNTSYEISVNKSKDTAKEDILSTKDSNIEITFHHQSSSTLDLCTLNSNPSACKSAVSFQEERQQPLTQDISKESEKITNTTIETSASFPDSLASQIKPTKTLSKEDLKKQSSVPILEPSKEFTEETLQSQVLTTVPPLSNPTPILKIVEELPVLGTRLETTLPISNIPLINIDSQEIGETTGTADTESIETVAQVKTDKSENGEQDGRQAKDQNEQEARLSSQDNLSLDSLLSDLKDLEVDTVNMQNGASSSSPTTQPTANVVPQKESVFLRLSNRIKILERNMSLSGQYLEELSRRYKKQVEEMQRSLERAVAAMGEESRKGEERDVKRAEEIATLKEEIIILSKSVETLLYDRDSWRSRISAIIQHALLICLEVVVIILVLSYCRRREDFEEEKLESDSRDTMRRKSAENFSSHAAAKKMKKRRPSEIASHISGTYHELMIDDRPYETKKERKKKRKKEATAASAKAIINTDARQEVRYKNMIPGGTTLPLRRASSTDRPHFEESQDLVGKRPESASETAIGWFDDQTERIERIAPQDKAEMESRASSELGKPNVSLVVTNRPIERSGPCTTTVERKLEKNGSFRAGSILKGARLSSPSFMKTALGARSKRKFSTNSTEKWEWSQDLEHSNVRSSQSSPTDFKTLSQIISDRANGSSANGLVIEESDESRSSSATPTSIKKEKRSAGLKKMVRKFF
ncbi:SUN domain-containing ossification factor isoform X2 [Monomorium pharaonis]|uniref:SUN domain-containing ossification factor isoform X2 n=1 Tax=Monomorium pharaonis TaxID=307658 RepID=UPI00063F1BC5|nr:SUN domain-containing ossification factor isoform X2 [Monomorium pharaonis]XP_028046338.1 SUN domain-containing ossification factor isoform X2 [Monomorium pharaonis]XP_028046339.1 SUN domain-containing ossification factor isoform X2 [Monomorium pharaonis]XP_028046340.1 SUN domain-containing ossification factor isoform X2 [Monomorium pharaonis]XP_028046341.1 SUN domain-containing ossification factor isoform X2 [Monomorium pharaonis]XP_028046342.1 SUN domain-containing ossification factor iso